MNALQEPAKEITVSEKMLDKFTEILGEYRVTLEAVKEILDDEGTYAEEVSEIQECLNNCKQKFNLIKYQTGYEPRNDQEVV